MTDIDLHLNTYNGMISGSAFKSYSMELMKQAIKGYCETKSIRYSDPGTDDFATEDPELNEFYEDWCKSVREFCK